VPRSTGSRAPAVPGRAPAAQAARRSPEPARAGLPRVLADFGLLTLSALLFALSFPSFLSDAGWFPLAFLCLTPAFVVAHRARWPLVPFYGLFFGYACYALFNFWLGRFHPLTLVVVPPIYAGYFLLLLPALKLADSLLPTHGYAAQAALWVCYEYFLKSRGFLAYEYGNLGYSQYLFLPLVRLSALTGVWGISLLTVLPSAILAGVLRDGLAAARARAGRYVVPAAAWAALFAAALMYGAVSRSDLSGARPWRVALVQQNVDPWKGGYTAYAESLRACIRQSDRALAGAPQIVVWSETSFVPAVEWHTRYRTDDQIYGLVRTLVGYVSSHGVPFVVGNDDGVLKRTEGGEEARVDYNAALLFDRGSLARKYWKVHLVPFTESFPFQKSLPGVYTWLKNADTHFWEQGTELTVFQAAGVRFSTPICFEDTFGDLCRSFIRAGAEVLVNLSNDAWSFSVPCAMQHMGMAVFRAAENRRSVVRSTNGGITCVIDPNGRITARLAPFTEAMLLADVPVFTPPPTLYNRWGDWFPWAMAVVAVGMVAGGAAAALRRRR
jgi:apolipoprotein N-acyltransferase